MESLFRHYAANESLYTATVSPVCEKYGLTYMEFTVLMFLANNPQFDTASDIVRYRHLTKSHVSMSVRSLQDKGLLKGEYHEPNRRTIHLTVLEAASPIVSDGRAAQQRYGSILFTGFSETEYELFVAYMQRIDNNITECLASRHNRQE
ncbi:MAG: winged helix-turn-helix transcriptional regulator [Clostridiales bacterium]|nr:winged helix-turn-helix transcriptional regulator [Clostridiales bacterium]